MREKLRILEPEKEKTEKASINPGEVFDPERELEKVKTIEDRGEKKEALEQYKEKLAYQREGLAKMQEEIIGRIEINPDEPLAEIYKVVKDYNQKYGFTAGQQLKIGNILLAYEKRHAAVKTVREQFPDDNKLYEYVFGRAPKGRVEVITGPMTLYFRCFNIEDYTIIAKQKFLEEKDMEEPIAAAEIEEMQRQGGISIATSRIEGLEGVLLAENSSFEEIDPVTSKKVQIHEEQHALKRLFKKPPIIPRGDVDKIEEMRDSQDPDKKRAAFEVFFRIWRNSILERIKDELLAMLKEERPIAEVFVTLTTPKEEEGLYDYPADIKKNTIESLVERVGENWRPLVEETADQVFGQEYKELIEGGIVAYYVLHNMGYSHEATIAVLITEPLAKWKKVVRRLQEQKK